MALLLRFIPLFLLTGCFSVRGPKKPNGNHVDGDGNVIVNAFTIASDYILYIGIMSLLAGVLIIIFLKMFKTGGQFIIAGLSCFILSQIVAYIGTHLFISVVGLVALTVLVGFVYHKAITTGLPRLEKLLNKDFNHDGNIGTNRTELEPSALIEEEPTA